MIGSLAVPPGSPECTCHWPAVCDGTGWMQCQHDCDCRCGGMRECRGCPACKRSGPLKAPFPWFGGKSRVADIVWERFGNVPNYVEPFFGSGAVLLGRPSTPGIETVNDIDCLLANFWRALQHDPEGVTSYADWPVNEADQHARHLWLVSQHDFREHMKTDPDFYDVKIAGWWVWGQSIWIGSRWCATTTYRKRQRPHLSDAGNGIHRQIPHLRHAGMGIHRRIQHLSDAGTGVHRAVTDSLLDYMVDLAERMRHVRVCCGNWTRILGPSPTFKLGTTGIFLDPPYSAEAKDRATVYANDDFDVAQATCEWAISNGDNPDLRIALCGYEGEYQMPDSWECFTWKAAGGYGSQGNGQGRENAGRERIWFSPFCERRQMNLFEDFDTEHEGVA